MLLFLNVIVLSQKAIVDFFFCFVLTSHVVLLISHACHFRYQV